jgi:membrane dipeptidase
MGEAISAQTRELLEHTIVWDNHACMPLRPGDVTFLQELKRVRDSNIDVISLNVCFDVHPPESAFAILAAFRHWVISHAADYVLADTVSDIEVAKRDGKLAVVFDIEGGRAVEAHPGFVDIFYRLGVRWMLIAYNKNNRLGGGCQDEDGGLTVFGRAIIDEMERVGMVLCCSHTGYRTAHEAIEYSTNPVIFSHSNPRAVWNHERNIPDDLMRACARSGGVVNINGIGIFLGANDNSTEALLCHIDYAAQLIGAEHVGLGLDYVFDRSDLDEYVRAHPDVYPPEKGYRAGILMVEPERIPVIAEGLVKRGYSEADIRGILGHNNLRVARQVWRK